MMFKEGNMVYSLGTGIVAAYQYGSERVSSTCIEDIRVE